MDSRTNKEDADLEIRRALNAAYTAATASEATRALRNLTFVDCVQEQIDLIEGTSSSTRPGVLSRIDRVEADVDAAIAALSARAPEDFAAPDAAQDVNTPVAGP